MFNKVLVPLDIRFIPTNALRAAAALAQSGAEITLLYVTDVARDFSDGGLGVLSESDVERYMTRVKEKIANALALLSEYGATGTTLTVQSYPVHVAINRVAKEMMADAILMGTHGRRGLSRALHGSVTEQVMREADVPVIAIRESSRTPFFPYFKNSQNTTKGYEL